MKGAELFVKVSKPSFTVDIYVKGKIWRSLSWEELQKTVARNHGWDKYDARYKQAYQMILTGQYKLIPEEIIDNIFHNMWMRRPSYVEVYLEESFDFVYTQGK